MSDEHKAEAVIEGLGGGRAFRALFKAYLSDEQISLLDQRARLNFNVNIKYSAATKSSIELIGLSRAFCCDKLMVEGICLVEEHRLFKKPIGKFVVCAQCGTMRTA